MALLDEECLFPKATDLSFAEKVHLNHFGKSENYGKPGNQKSQSTGEFQIHHYAGSVCVLACFDALSLSPGHVQC